MATALLLDSIYKQHLTGSGHPERPERYDAVNAGLEREGLVRTRPESRAGPPLKTKSQWPFARIHCDRKARYPRGKHELSTVTRY